MVTTFQVNIFCESVFRMAMGGKFVHCGDYIDISWTQNAVAFAMLHCLVIVGILVNGMILRAIRSMCKSYGAYRILLSNMAVASMVQNICVVFALLVSHYELREDESLVEFWLLLAVSVTSIPVLGSLSGLVLEWHPSIHRSVNRPHALRRTIAIIWCVTSWPVAIGTTPVISLFITFDCQELMILPGICTVLFTFVVVLASLVNIKKMLTTVDSSQCPDPPGHALVENHGEVEVIFQPTEQAMFPGNGYTSCGWGEELTPQNFHHKVADSDRDMSVDFMGHSRPSSVCMLQNNYFKTTRNDAFLPNKSFSSSIGPMGQCSATSAGCKISTNSTDNSSSQREGYSACATKRGTRRYKRKSGPDKNFRQPRRYFRHQRAVRPWSFKKKSLADTHNSSSAGAIRTADSSIPSSEDWMHRLNHHSASVKEREKQRSKSQPRPVTQTLMRKDSVSSQPCNGSVRRKSSLTAFFNIRSASRQSFYLTNSFGTGSLQDNGRKLSLNDNCQKQNTAQTSQSAFTDLTKMESLEIHSPVNSDISNTAVCEGDPLDHSAEVRAPKLSDRSLISVLEFITGDEEQDGDGDFDSLELSDDDFLQLVSVDECAHEHTEDGDDEISVVEEKHCHAGHSGQPNHIHTNPSSEPMGQHQRQLHKEDDDVDISSMGRTEGIIQNTQSLRCKNRRLSYLITPSNASRDLHSHDAILSEFCNISDESCKHSGRSSKCSVVTKKIDFPETVAQSVAYTLKPVDEIPGDTSFCARRCGLALWHGPMLQVLRGALGILLVILHATPIFIILASNMLSSPCSLVLQVLLGTTHTLYHAHVHPHIFLDLKRLLGLRPNQVHVATTQRTQIISTISWLICRV